jgi:protein-S-isoprenylcysteine O-methyltransferase Ste14
MEAHMRRLLLALFGLVSYVVFLATFTYFVGFVAGWGVPKSVDGGATTAPAAALAIDFGLVAFFGVVHSVMARARFKRIWTRVVPTAAERSVYVLIAALQLALVFWQWRALPSPTLWSTRGAAALVLVALQGLGWTLALASTFLIDHFELFGLRQSLGRTATVGRFRTPLFYRWVRHPLYLGMLIALWSAPTMSAGHALLAALFTGYLLIGVRHEERDLVRTFGEAYRRYQAEVPMLVPLPRRGWRLAGDPVSK